MNATSPGTRKERALELLRANRLEEARDLCDEVARTENSVGAWHLLGVIHGMLGDVREAERCSRAATDLKPDYADAHANLGMALRLQGKLDEAIASLREAVRLKPDHAEAHYQLGMALAADQRMDEAITSLREAVHRRPDNADAHVYLGAAQAAIGQFDEAATSFREGLHLDPRHVDARICLGNVLVDLGQFEESAEQYRRALEQRPNDPELLNNLGNTLSELGKPDEAIAHYERALEHEPAYIAALHNLGIACLNAGKPESAERCCRRILELQPDHAPAMTNLGSALAGQKHTKEAISHYRRALSLKPDYAEAHFNLGNAMRAQGAFEQAIESYRRAIALDPNHADAHFNLASTCLALGQFAPGWEAYQWQWRRKDAKARLFTPSTWDGADLAGRNVFLHAEQGLGDELFFLRFVAALRRRGAGNIVYLANPKLAPLLRRSTVVDRIAPLEEKPSKDSLVLSVGDLPRLMGMKHARDIPPPVTLTALTDRVAEMRSRLAALGPPPYIGVTWRGGTKSKKNVLYKESPPETIAQILRGIPATVLVLQRHPQPGEIEAFGEALGRPVHDLSSLNEDLERMLALLSLMDEYVGVSNTNMHLRAAVGRTAKVLVPAPPEWRWMAQGKESPWFPGFGVYRQGYNQSWDTAFTELRQDLGRVFGEIKP